MNNKLIETIKDFMNEFEEVFDNDWKYSKERMGIHSETKEQKIAAQKMGLESIDIIADDGTFINPRVDDEIEDWGHRGALLFHYRKLKKMLDD